MITPKKTFQEDAKALKQLHEVVETKFFIQVAKDTLLQIVLDTPDEHDQIRAIGHYHRIMGAKHAIHALLGMAEVKKPETSRQSVGNLQTNK